MSRPAILAAVLALAGLSTVACGGTTGAGTGSSEAAKPLEAKQDGTAQAVSEAVAPAKPLAGKVIVIDPGHNGGNYKHPEIINKQVNVLTKWKTCDTTGTATNDGYSEAAFTWDVSRRLAKLLRAAGATVKLTRVNNTSAGPCITKRAAIGNAAKADAAISIHADGAAAGSHGFHVIMPKKINGPVDPVVADSKKLGLAIRNAVHAGTGMPYSNYIGSKALDYRNDLGGLNLSSVPKVFLESGNMRNAGDAAKLKSAAWRQKLAESLVQGFQTYLK
ncbi:N-acetylmuramoyl-L-alanine amidase [Acrocarpospora corrugata]|uniref:N-acetylmuramoyl-L-alanine amidase n=1 Tax=Acrocarpospora corrugata TaxID=35763 RepID=A0A5M3W224_9ACTN|nr:N-acetylmuramoyl-L-alanine amidase [Acrocarpospora corrugata]GES02082.1 N-acetylmuramoyl-L-alanine amidase [Acrocarpospora corrugata]